MSNHQRKLTRSLTGHFLGWGDDRTPHRYIRLATPNGEQLVKIAKSLRPQIQDWQPGIWLTLLSQERIGATGEIEIKVKQLLTLPQMKSPLESGFTAPVPPTIERYPAANSPVLPTKIQVCQGSSCRRRGSEGICHAMQTYLDRHDLTDRVEIETVKCLHQCKAAPHAIVTNPAGAILPGKTHYRQIQPTQVSALLAKHFPIDVQPESIGSNFIEKIGAYLQHQVSTAVTH
ncbi:(2Fe-2S) ferredoxin domain-containing protein [Chamaesiphon sp.]|uniref:(2Fe-2S) ferredoxin domain-containing protein n=1 Tax=Chamaesiphon sp. TaxID=2814140 RepID=UPI0035932E10